MKIALVVHDFLKGVGHGRYCIELAARLSRDHEIHVLANRFEAGLPFRFQQRFVGAWRQTALTSVLTFPGAAEKILHREKFDIIHAQGFACRRADVITAHVCNAARYKRAPASGLIKKIFPAWVIPRERRFYRESGAGEVIAVSKILQRELAEEYGIANACVIYHGVNGDEFFPVEMSANSRAEKGKGWRWMFAGEAAKGLGETLQALKGFPETTLLVVTRSETAEWQEFAKKLGVANRVDFHGPSNDMRRCYQSADVFVYPSPYDTFGMVVAEAMACGLPVVVGKDIGAAEWIEDERNGFVCAPSDLISKLQSLKRMPAEALRKLVENARATALAQSWDRCAAETLAVYERVMASKRKSK